MKVKDLRKLLETVPDDYLIVTPSYDHRFSLCDVMVGSVQKEGREYTETVKSWEDCYAS